jgi:ABC-2 type transport system ATP-binding protein
MSAITVTGLTKKFGNLTAVNNVSFTVPEGEIFGYLGPNGAGKTTTIRILTGITAPTAGTATILGHDIQRETLTARSHMGIVPETSNIYDDLTGWQNLMFTAELYRVGKAERETRARELLETFQILDRKDDKVHGYSKGMKRRLTLSMGLINDPRLLFLDEPTSGLDVQSNLIIRDVIRDLNDRGVTVFLTTHNIEEANALCHRVAIINRGMIAAIDAPERLKQTIQSVQSVELAFDHVAPEILEALHRIPEVSEVRKEGDRVRLYTPDPGSVLEAAMASLKAQGIRPLSVNTLGPSLEDVFVKLTGLDRGHNRDPKGK